MAGFPTLNDVPAPVLATSLGREPHNIDGPDWDDVVMIPEGFSLCFVTVAPFPDDLDARNVLLTDTALKLVGFLMADTVRAWPLSSFAVFKDSGLVLSLSEAVPAVLPFATPMLVFSAVPFTDG